jgi:hypothetical protein
MPLICKGLRFPLCSIFNHLLTFLPRRLPLGKKERRMRRRRSKSMTDIAVSHVRLNEKLWNAHPRRKKHHKPAAQQNGLLGKPSHWKKNRCAFNYFGNDGSFDAIKCRFE